MACNCANCGLALDRSLCVILRDDASFKYFCDDSCFNQWFREDTKDEFEINIAEFETHLKQKLPCVEKRFLVIMLMFFKALLARKPREELLRLNEIRRKVLCEAIEYYMIEGNDKLAFYFGEAFKTTYELRIDAWATPQ